MSFTEDESRQALVYAKNGAMFMFRANEELSTEALKGGDFFNGMPEFLKIMLIKRIWINLDSKTIVKYCKKTIDRKNKYVFDNSDIKVIPEPIKI